MTILRNISFQRFLFLSIFLCSLLSGGCFNFQLKVGREPDVKALETALTVGKSSKEEVLKVLGEPYGLGQEMVPLTSAPRGLLQYYYETGNSSDDRRIFLFVFLKEDIYDGYMWFSSL